MKNECYEESSNTVINMKNNAMRKACNCVTACSPTLIEIA